MANFKEAERRILEAQKNPETGLDLSNLGLTTADLLKLIPFMRGHNFRKFNLSGNNFDTIDPLLEMFPDLVELDASGNKDLKINETLVKKLGQLESSSLDEGIPGSLALQSKIRENKIQKRIGDALSKDDGKLDLSGLDLTTADLDTVVNFINGGVLEVKELNLSNNALSNINILHKLPKFITLNVQDNNISGINERLLNYFKQLKALSIDDGVLDPNSQAEIQIHTRRIREVEKRIDKAIEESNEVLDLSGLGLTTFNLEVLATLLEKKEFTPKKLVLLNNNIDKIPKAITELGAKIELIPEHEFKRLENKVESACRRGSVLNLSKMGITTAVLQLLFSKDKKEYSGIERLILADNQITEVPDEIRKATKSTYIDLSGNSIREIDETLPEALENLEEFKLDDNPLNAAAKAALQAKLRENIIRIRIEQAVERKSKTLDLSRLDLTTADLERWNPIIKRKLPRLEELNLNGNQIDNAASLVAFKNLKRLNLSNNNLSDIGVLSKLKNLTELYLSGNSIYNTEFLSKLRKLKKFYANNCNLSDFGFLSKLTKLTVLHLSGNQIGNVRHLDNLKKFKNLEDLNVSNNGLSDIDPLADLKKLKKLNVSQNEIREMEQSLMEKFQESPDFTAKGNPVQTTIRRNKAKKVIEDAAKRGDNKLNLSGLELTTEDLAFLVPSIPPNLTYLNLGGNQITDISAVLVFKQLKTLNIAQNQVDQLPPEIHTLTHLEIIDLSRNRVTEFPERMARLEALQVLHAAHNPLSTVTMQWLESTFRSRLSVLMYDMAAHDQRRDYRVVLQELYGAGSAAMLEIIEGLTKVDYTIGDPNDKNKPPRAVSGKDILVTFLEKLPQQQGKLQDVFHATIRYLLNQIVKGVKDNDENYKVTLQLIAVALGNCATPVKKNVLQNAVGLAIQGKIDIAPELLDVLITMLALEKEIREALPSDAFSANEAIEGLNGLLNAIFLKGAENNPDNKMKITGRVDTLPSLSAYPNFAFNRVEQEWVTPVAKICCKTDASGKPIKDKNDCYEIDPNKLRQIKEKYEAIEFNLFSPLEEYVRDFKIGFNKFRKEECADIYAFPSYTDEEALFLDTKKHADALRKRLYKADENGYKKVVEKFLEDLKEKGSKLKKACTFAWDSEKAFEKVLKEYEAFNSKGDPSIERLFDVTEQQRKLRLTLEDAEPGKYDGLLKQHIKLLKYQLEKLKELKTATTVQEKTDLNRFKQPLNAPVNKATVSNSGTEEVRPEAAVQQRRVTNTV